MLKVTFLTCAIIAAQPLVGEAKAGDDTSASLSMVWTGRFVDMTRAPVLGNASVTPGARHSRRTDGNGDPDIVGSIPSNPADEGTRDVLLLRSGQTLSLCTLPGMSPTSEGDSLTCGGAWHNRWSAKAGTFNYDLSSVKPDFANAPVPYVTSWDALPTAEQ